MNYVCKDLLNGTCDGRWSKWDVELNRTRLGGQALEGKKKIGNWGVIHQKRLVIGWSLGAVTAVNSSSAGTVHLRYLKSLKPEWITDTHCKSRLNRSNYGI